ncbi:neuronal acetylcholine receptor subunit alpha-7 [Elysia marginata]|uniref:Neuronal acetylcholine receptor subunit alpha-7 n=1 Tax=Elysia marginata TaxID=1093978 RepID=A0AAV4JZR4_9GAST|nr:neuronal acetylcholine receptor subunit alpha-7 [Elysia marginata]
MWLCMWLVISLKLVKATGKCSVNLHGKDRLWNLKDETTLQTTLSLLGDLNKRCGIPPLLPPMEFYKPSSSWTVALSFQPLQVVNVDEIEQSVTLSSYLILTWIDSSLSWEPKRYRGIKSVTMKLTNIWTPTVVVPKTTQSTGIKLQLPDKVSVRSDGQVTVPVPHFISTLCEFDMRDFPFDSHRCSIVFLEQEFFLNMTAFKAETSDVKTYFGTNAGWLLEEEGCISRLSNSSQFPTITYVLCHVRLKRRSAFYVINLIGPMALTSVMTLIVFWIPPEEREKVSFVTSVFMSTSLYLGFILDRLPRSMETVPYLNLLLMVIVAEVILATVATAFVLQYSTNRHENLSQASENQTGELTFSENLSTEEKESNLLSDSFTLKCGCQSKTDHLKTAKEDRDITSEELETKNKNENNQNLDVTFRNSNKNLHPKSHCDSQTAQKQRQNLCCAISCFGNSKVDKSDNKITQCVTEQSYEEKLSGFSKLPRISLNQTKEANAFPVENRTKQVNKDEASQSIRHTEAFSLNHLRHRFVFEVPSKGTMPCYNDYHEKEDHITNKAPTGNGNSKSFTNRKSYSHSGQKQGCKILIPDCHLKPDTSDKEESHNTPVQGKCGNTSGTAKRKACPGLKFVFRMLRKSNEPLEPADFDRMFFWIMLVIIVITWLSFLIPTHFKS